MKPQKPSSPRVSPQYVTRVSATATAGLTASGTGPARSSIKVSAPVSSGASAAAAAAVAKAGGEGTNLRPVTMVSSRQTDQNRRPSSIIPPPPPPSISSGAGVPTSHPIWQNPTQANNVPRRPSFGQDRNSTTSIASASTLAPAIPSSGLSNDLPPPNSGVAAPAPASSVAAAATGGSSTSPFITSSPSLILKLAGFYVPPPGYPPCQEPEYDIIGTDNPRRQQRRRRAASGDLEDGRGGQGPAGRCGAGVGGGWGFEDGLDFGAGRGGVEETTSRGRVNGERRSSRATWPFDFFGDSSTHRDWTIPQAKQILSSYATLAALLAGTNTTLLGYYGRQTPTDSSILALCYAALVLDVWGALLAVLTIVVSITLQAPDVAFMEKEMNRRARRRKERKEKHGRRHRHGANHHDESTDPATAAASAAATATKGYSEATTTATTTSTTSKSGYGPNYREEAERALLGEGGGFALGPLGRPRYEAAHPLVYGTLGSSTMDGRGKPLSPLSISILDRLTLACGYIIPLGGTLELASLAVHVAKNDPFKANMGVAVAGAFCVVTTGGCLISGWISGRRKVESQLRREREVERRRREGAFGGEEHGDSEEEEEEEARLGEEVRVMHSLGRSAQWSGSTTMPRR